MNNMLLLEGDSMTWKCCFYLFKSTIVLIRTYDLQYFHNSKAVKSINQVKY